MVTRKTVNPCKAACTGRPSTILVLSEEVLLSYKLNSYWSNNIVNPGGRNGIDSGLWLNLIVWRALAISF